MAIRVTSVSLYALHTSKTALTGYGDSKYDHNYNAYDGYVDGTNDTFIGVTLENVIGSGSYFLAGFEQQEGGIFSSIYDLNAYVEHEGIGASGGYSLEVWVPVDGAATLAYALTAFITLDGQHYGQYDLNAYAAKEQVFQSEYELQVYLLAQGYTDGLYDVDTYVDLLMQVVSSYDLHIYEQNDNVIGTSAYDLLAWEAREVAVGSHFALLTFLQQDGYLDAESRLEVYAALDERFGVKYDLFALELLQGITDSKYAINVWDSAQLQIDGTYSLDIFKAFDGFVDSVSVLNAYQQTDGFTDGQYGISVYLARTGFADGVFDLQAFVGKTGFVNGLYLLDTTQELFTWVINHNTGAPSRYENYDFDAFAVIGQDYLAARGDGIFLLDGDDDDGAAIDAIATIGRTDFDEPVLKRVTAAYLGLNSAGQAHLTLRTDQGITSGPYQLRQTPAASTTERAKFRRGVKSRYWEIDIENVDGEDLQVKSAEFETVILGEKRRLKK